MRPSGRVWQRGLWWRPESRSPARAEARCPFIFVDERAVLLVERLEDRVPLLDGLRRWHDDHPREPLRRCSIPARLRRWGERQSFGAHTASRIPTFDVVQTQRYVARSPFMYP